MIRNKNLTSINFVNQLLIREWPNVLTLLGGLIAIKTAIITTVGPFVGLTLPESVRIGLLLSQGGEFAFVVFSLCFYVIVYYTVGFPHQSRDHIPTNWYLCEVERWKEVWVLGICPSSGRSRLLCQCHWHHFWMKWVKNWQDLLKHGLIYHRQMYTSHLPDNIT